LSSLWPLLNVRNVVVVVGRHALDTNHHRIRSRILSSAYLSSLFMMMFVGSLSAHHRWRIPPPFFVKRRSSSSQSSGGTKFFLDSALLRAASNVSRDRLNFPSGSERNGRRTRRPRGEHKKSYPSSSTASISYTLVFAPAELAPSMGSSPGGRKSDIPSALKMKVREPVRGRQLFKLWLARTFIF